jgi:ribosomal protein S18 acetylase RimI-like enzyme
VIEYRESPGALEHLTEDDLRGGFWEGWPTPPTPATHLAHLRGAEVVVLAVDTSRDDAVVGFVSAVGDGVLVAFVPLLEVLPAYRGQGIGTQLMRRVLDRLSDRYSVDLVCDPALVPYYERLGGTRLDGIGWRNRLALEQT